MALKRSAKITLGIIGGAIVVGGVTWAVVSSAPPPKKKKPKVEPEPDPDELEPPSMGEPPRLPTVPGITLTPPAVLEEPKGGWEFRWDQEKAEAIPACRAEIGAIDKLPWNGAWTELWRCIARRTFPETAGRLDYDEWPSWLRNQAAARIRQDVSGFLGEQGVSTQGWKFMLWLRFDGVIEGCYEALAPHEDAITHCVASEIYPDQDWPPEEIEGWKADFWNELEDMVAKYVDLQEGRGEPFELDVLPPPGPPG